MIHYNVAKILKSEGILSQEVALKGWVRTFRSNRFIALNDGSTIHNIQCVINFEKTPEEILRRINTGAAVSIKGVLTESLGRGQSVEIQVSEIEILGDSNPDEYQTVRNIQERKTRLVQDNFILASNFNYVRNSRENA